MSQETLSLCYVDGAWAYFTSQALEKQWGDDWNDAPYEHNAGEPYAYNPEHDKEKEPWRIWKVAWEGDLETPDWNRANSSYSVEMINRGDVPWLVTPPYRKGSRIAIYAGATFYEFVEKVQEVGGTIYTPMSGPKTLRGAS